MSSNNYFRALYNLVTVVNSSLKPETVYSKIVEQTAFTMKCKASTMRLLDPTGTLLLATASWGLSDGYMRKGPVEIAKNGMDREVMQGKTIYLRDATEDGRFQYPESAKKEGLISVISVPLMFDAKTFGLLRAYSNENREFTAEECEFMEAVAEVSAIAIANSRLHEELKENYKLQKEYSYQVFDD